MSIRRRDQQEMGDDMYSEYDHTNVDETAQLLNTGADINGHDGIASASNFENNNSFGNEIHVRQVAVEIKASLSDADASSKAVTTSVPAAAMSMFLKRDPHRKIPVGGSIDSITQHESNSLNNIALHKVTIKHAQNGFPVDVGLNITGVEGKTYSCTTGKPFATIVFSGSEYQTPNLVHNEDNHASQVFTQRYPGFNVDNLRTEQIGTMHGTDYTLVGQNHPFMDLLRENNHLLKTDITGSPLVDGRFYKVDNNVFESCMSRLEDQLKRDCKRFSWSNLKFSLERPCGSRWTDPDGNINVQSTMNQEQRAAVMKDKNAFKALVEMEYSFI